MGKLSFGKIRKAVGGILAFSISTQAATLPLHSVYYKVEHKDTISQILYSLNMKPIYGPKGMLEKTLALNPHKRNSSELLKPGEILILPATPTHQGAASVASPIPPASRSPASESRIEPSAKESESVPSQLAFLNSFHSYHLNSTDPATQTKANLFSRSCFGSEIRITHEIDPDSAISMGIGITKIEFESPSNPLISLQGQSRTLYRFGASYRQKVSAKAAFEVSAEQEQRLFLGSSSVTTLSIDQRPIPALKAALRYSLVEKSRFSLIAQASGTYFAPVSTDSYSVLGGYQIGAGLWMHKKIGSSFSLDTGVFGSTSAQNTSQAHNLIQDYGLGLGLSWVIPD